MQKTRKHPSILPGKSLAHNLRKTLIYSIDRYAFKLISAAFPKSIHRSGFDKQHHNEKDHSGV